VKRFECVDDQKAAGFPVTAACEAAEVSTSGYYDWCARRDRGPSEREIDEARLVELMRQIWDASDGNYGVPRMRADLARHGIVANKKKVERLMRRHNMAGRCRRRRGFITTIPGPDGYVIPDLIGRRFEVGHPDRGWVQDITYIPTGEGWLFLAGVVDLGSRRLVGYSMDDHMRTELVLGALEMAIAARGGTVTGVIAHADRGSQYTSNDYLDFCANHRLRPSVGRTGVCWDNAVVESFWESLKRECLQGRIFPTRADARRAIFRWINWYNHQRLHSSLGNIPPIEWELQYPQAS
jgi:transposase InsO family protein